MTMAQKYMLQTSTNRVHAYHPLTIKRKDMVEISEPQAKNILAGRPMMEGLTAQDVINVVPGSAQRGPDVSPAGETGDKAIIAILHRKLAGALKLLGMTSIDQIPDDTPEGGVIMDEVPKEQWVPALGPEPDQGPAPEDGKEYADPDIKMLEEIRAKGKGKAKVAAYCLTQFGVTVDARMRVTELVDQAIGLRKKLLLTQPAVTTEPETPS
jgi:hypothetical protein